MRDHGGEFGGGHARFVEGLIDDRLGRGHRELEDLLAVHLERVESTGESVVLLGQIVGRARHIEFSPE